MFIIKLSLYGKKSYDLQSENKSVFLSYNIGHKNNDYHNTLENEKIAFIII